MYLDLRPRWSAESADSSGGKAGQSIQVLLLTSLLGGITKKQKNRAKIVSIASPPIFPTSPLQAHAGRTRPGVSRRPGSGWDSLRGRWPGSSWRPPHRSPSSAPGVPKSIEKRQIQYLCPSLFLINSKEAGETMKQDMANTSIEGILVRKGLGLNLF